MMYNVNNYTNFLCIIDVYSQRLWTIPQKTKSAPETLSSLKTVFEKYSYPNKIEFDQGLEFKTNADFLVKNGTFVKYKVSFVIKLNLKLN